MDLTDQIEAYIEAKGYSRNTVGPVRSVLGDFNVFQMHQPAATMAEKASRYGQYVRERQFLKPKTVERHVGTVRRFCKWLEETGRVEAFKLDEQMLGRPEMRKVPDPPIGGDEIVRMMHVAAVSGKAGVRDAAMTLLAVTVGLSASEISSLNSSHAEGFGRGDELFYCGRFLRLPKVTSRVLGWYAMDRRPQYGADALFTEDYADDGARLSPEFVRERIEAMLDVVGVPYEAAVPGDCQLRIAQHFKSLDEAGRRLAAASVQSCAYSGVTLPKPLVDMMLEGALARRQARRDRENPFRLHVR